MSTSSGRHDGLAAARRGRGEDRDERVYERRRAKQARRRAALDRDGFDHAPPTDDDWTVAEEESDAVRRVTPPTPVGESVEALIRRRGWHERLRAATAWARWSEIVGAELADRCEPVRLAGGTLVVRAESQAWAAQLRYLTVQLVTNAEAVLGVGTVRGVRVVVGPLERSAPEA